MRIGIALRISAFVFAAVIAAWLLSIGFSVHVERACFLLDTPYLPLCGRTEGGTEANQQAQLRSYLRTNPGDSTAWISLTSIDTEDHQLATLRAAMSLAPTEANVMMWSAGQALAKNDLLKATELLVQIVQYRGNSEAAQALARILATSEGTPLLRPHLDTAARWLPQVLEGLAALKLPLTSALSLVAESSRKGALPQATLKSYLRGLKSAGNWGDAYGLWLAQQRGPTPLLHNGKFEQRFDPDGFDWEVTPALPSRTGAVVAQRRAAGRGQVLEIEYTGKAVPTPVLRQYVFLPPGKYILRGQYMTSKLHMEQGLAWAMRCVNGKAANPLAGQSDALQDTSGAWKPFQFVITVPFDCGLVASMQLETFAPFEAATGFKGRAAFDSLDLRAESS